MQDTLNSTNNLAVFCLARGYPTWKLHKYLKLCARNLFIRRALKVKTTKYDMIIFHEGNIPRQQQTFIKIFSLTWRIKFISVAKEFTLPSNFNHPMGIVNLGYVFMCRFSYLTVWNYLENYETVMRIDDDVFLLEIDANKTTEIFDYAFISNEMHEPTNNSLRAFLTSKGKDALYDHEFPYTNFYVTKPSYWLRRDMQVFLLDIGNCQEGIDDRWGDATILGIALKEFQDWTKTQLRSDVKYLHMSHRSIVTNGLNLTIYSRIELKFPKTARIIRSLFNRWKSL